MTGIIKTDQLQGAQSSTIAVPSGNNLTVGGTLGVTGVLTGTSLDISGNIDIDGTSNLDVVDIDGAVNMASTLIVSGTTTIQKASSGGTANSSAALVIEGTDATKAHIQLLCDNSDVQSIYFGDAADNDIGRIAYDHTGNTMRFNVNASERMRISSSGNVGIGTSSPSETLDVVGDARATRLIGRSLIESSSGFSSDTFAVMGGNTSNASTSHGAVFFSKHVDSNALLVGTHDATFNSFVVKGNGNVGIGTSSISHKLEVHSANATNIVAKSTNGNGGYLNYSGLSSGGTTTFSVTHNGRVYAGDGILLGGTGDVNHLDDYEEGTFTPTVSNATGYSAQFGTYKKIGQLVFINANIVVTSASGSTNTISNLPFASKNTGNSSGNLSIGYYSDINTPMVWFSGYVLNASTNIYISGNSAGHTGATIQHNGGNMFKSSGNSRIMFSVVYESA